MANWRGRGDFFWKGEMIFEGIKLGQFGQFESPSWRRFLCFVRRTTSIQTADLNFFKKFENDSRIPLVHECFYSFPFLHAPRVCPTANVTTTSRTSPVATETAKTDGTFRTPRSWRWSSEVLRYDFNTPPNGKVVSGLDRVAYGNGLRGTHWKVWVNALVCRQKLKQEYSTLLPPFFDCARWNHLGTSNLNSITACLPMLFHPTTIITKNL